MPRFIIGNQKYPKGLGGPSGVGGHGGFKPPPFGFNDYSTKILSTSLGISICTLTSCVSLGVKSLDFILTTVWASATTNGVSVTIIID